MRLRKWCLVQEVHKRLLWLLIVVLSVSAILACCHLFVQIYLLWLDLKESRMLFLWFGLTIVLFFLMRLVVESDGAFGDVASRALLRAWLARICGSFKMLAVQVEMEIVSCANYRVLGDGLVAKLSAATDLIQICR